MQTLDRFLTMASQSPVLSDLYKDGLPDGVSAALDVAFARQRHSEGASLVEATLEAAHLRLRPIIMTSLAFTLGVVPLMLASGASAETQHAIGTGVFGGMIAGTLLALFFVPVFFLLVMRWATRLSGRNRPY